LQKLATKIVDKPWGKRGIDPRFRVESDRQVGRSGSSHRLAASSM
jgi:hypothetical protein